MTKNHIEHFEDVIFENSEDIREILEKDALLYRIKYDGSLCVVFGVDETRQNFISTKSYFNKTPKKAYCAEDIEAKFDNERVVNILKFVFEKLEFVNLRERINQSGFQYENNFCVIGDFLYKKGFEETGGKTCPNVIEYDFSEHPEDMAIAWHTICHDGVCSWSNEIQNIIEHDDIYNPVQEFSVEISSIKLKEARTRSLQFLKKIENALEWVNSLTDEQKDDLKGFYTHLIKTDPQTKRIYNHFNAFFNTEATPNIFWFYIQKRYKKKESKYKTEKKKKEIEDKYIFWRDLISNRKTFIYICDIFRLYSFLIEYKEQILKHIGAIEHEGIVVSTDSRMTKLVSRAIFSYNNFRKWGEIEYE